MLLFAAIAAACADTATEQDKVRQLLMVRSQALNNRNLQLYLTTISAQYSDHGRDFAAMRDSLEASFKVFERVSYQAGEQKVEIQGPKAEVSGEYRMKVVIRGREMSLDGKEHIRLAKEAGGWKIIAGL